MPASKQAEYSKLMKQPIVQPAGNGLMRNVYYYRYITSTEKSITVPPDFLFDGNSTPVNRFKPSRLAGALIHDYLYRFGKYDDGSKCTRLEADQIYYTILRKCGTWRITRATFFAGLRLLGWYAWWKHVSTRTNNFKVRQCLYKHRVFYVFSTRTPAVAPNNSRGEE